MALISQHDQGSPGLLEGLVGSKDSDRRTFLKRTGVAVAALGVAAGCTDETVSPLATGNPSLADISLGSGDVAVLNYAFALEQLEAAFYERVITTPYTGITGDEYRTLQDIRDHEVAHREFFRAALGAAAIPNLSVNFSSITFSSRASVLATAQTFEDLGVAAYNGAGQLLTSADFLLAAGKIVSVEARHASAIRGLVSQYVNGNSYYTRFSGGDGVVDAMGLDRAMTPAQVLTAAAPFLNDRLITTGLPTS